MTSIFPARLMGPDYLMPHVRRPEDLLEIQRTNLLRGQLAHPRLTWHTPHEVEDPQVVYVNWSQIMIRCACGNAPLVQKAWSLAACIECGAIYRQFVWPDAWDAIERLLCLRPRVEQRNWNSPPGPTPETVEQLTLENLAQGDPIV